MPERGGTPIQWLIEGMSNNKLNFISLPIGLHQTFSRSSYSTLKHKRIREIKSALGSTLSKGCKLALLDEVKGGSSISNTFKTLRKVYGSEIRIDVIGCKDKYHEKEFKHGTYTSLLRGNIPNSKLYHFELPMPFIDKDRFLNSLFPINLSGNNKHITGETIKLINSNSKLFFKHLQLLLSSKNSIGEALSMLDGKITNRSHTFLRLTKNISDIQKNKGKGSAERKVKERLLQLKKIVELNGSI